MGTDQCADLKSISLVKLLAGDGDSAKDLVQACKENGFFYLDFRNDSTSEPLQQVDELIEVGNAVFKLPLEEKEQYSTEKYLPSRLLGYVISDRKHPAALTLRLDTNELVVRLDHSQRKRMDMRAFR